ncbi:MAG: adenylate/guanylate cyclase domain-containing protein [Treponema sp.]|nr:adenylate/guanylate cyclase domain-containing protein [Treponema sp.]
MDAVRAALEFTDCKKKFNTLEICNGHKVDAWIGIHYGRMIIGTIGEENRMDDTVISDTVNTAARIESVCEKLGKNIIVSQALEQLILQEKTIQVELNELEAMYVKGKEKPLQLFEVSRKAKKTQETGEIL